MTQVEELISRVTVQGDSKYLGALSKMDSAAVKFGRTATSMAGRVTGAFASIGRAMTSNVGILGAGVGAGGLFGIGAMALKASADVEQLTVTLEALTGSAETAQRKLQFIRALAIPSPFTFRQLAEAGTQLESFGLRVEKVLPLASKLGAAFGASTEDLQTIGRLFGRLAQGDFPDIEIMSRFGLNKAQFRQQGIKFDENGQMESSAREALDALDRIVNTKYGNILQKISSTTNAKLATLQDKWQITMAKIGDGIAKSVIPWLDRLSAFLDKLSQGDGLTKFTQKLLGNFARIVAVTTVVAHTFLLVVAALAAVSRNFVLAATAVAAAFAVMHYGRRLAEGIRDMSKRPLPSAGGNSALPPGSEMGTWSNTGDDSALGALGRIEKNTARTAKASEHFSNLDLKKFIFGVGGNNAGYDASDIGRMRGQNNRSVRIDAGQDALGRALGTYIEDCIRQLQRQGLIRVN